MHILVNAIEMKATAIKIKVERKSCRIANHLAMTKYKYHPCNREEYTEGVKEERSIPKLSSQDQAI